MKFRSLFEKEQTPSEYLKDAGYKFTVSNTEKGREAEFRSEKDAKAALEDLMSAGFGEKYSLNLVGKYIECIKL